jgi:hypothetical protein
MMYKMSRWSSEEDLYILESIKNITDDINYSELISSHNKRFNKIRSEEAYKVRVRKIAKENNISLKSNNHWLEEEKEYIINNIKNNPFNINWMEMSEHLKRSESSIKTMYYELVKPIEHIEYCLSKLDYKDIMNTIESVKNTCSKCKRNIYSNPCIWQGLEYCDECYYNEYNEQIKLNWELVREYSIKTNKNGCNICGKKASFDNSMANRFHYDHINMFNKTDSICKLVREGVNIDIIYNEIDKCQLLCISCHSIVTKVEGMCSFIRIKRQMTKEFNETDDKEKKDKLIEEYSEIYSTFMNKVYAHIKASI